jgi:hypothetical protein
VPGVVVLIALVNTYLVTRRLEALAFDSAVTVRTDWECRVSSRHSYYTLAGIPGAKISPLWGIYRRCPCVTAANDCHKLLIVVTIGCC